jgi:hypothetical protein
MRIEKLNRKKNKKKYESQFPTNKITYGKIEKKIIKNKKQKKLTCVCPRLESIQASI